MANPRVAILGLGIMSSGMELYLTSALQQSPSVRAWLQSYSLK
jgi:hypothetical protein